MSIWLVSRFQEQHKALACSPPFSCSHALLAFLLPWSETNELSGSLLKIIWNGNILMQFIVLSDVFGYRAGGDQAAGTCNLFFQTTSIFELVKVAQESNPSWEQFVEISLSKHDWILDTLCYYVLTRGITFKRLISIKGLADTNTIVTDFVLTELLRILQPDKALSANYWMIMRVT